MALKFGQMKKGRSVPVSHSGLTTVQMGLMNIENDLNSWREETKKSADPFWIPCEGPVVAPNKLITYQ